MYFGPILAMILKTNMIQAGCVLTHPIRANGIVCKGENVCIIKVNNRNIILCKNKKEQKT